MTQPVTAAAAAPRHGLAPLALLVGSGGLLAVIVAITRLAGAAGIPPLAWAFAMALGAGAVLTGIASATGFRPPLARRHLAYYAIAGLIGMGLPNLILFSVVPYLGVGLASVLYAFPPLLTLLLAAVLRTERVGLRRAAGIALGFAGVLLIVGPRGSLPSPDLIGWMLLALAVPVLLAIGNIYRTARWPAGAAPLALAAGTLLGGALWLAVALAASGRLGDLALLARAPKLVGAVVLVSSLQFLLFFRLQKVGGPVYLSQLGYVAVATGLGLGVLMFDESYSLWVWGAVALIATGVAFVNSGRR